MDEGKQDVNVRAVTKFGLGLTGGVIVVAFLMWFLFDRFAAREEQHSPQPEPMQTKNPQKAPPEPRLQPNPPLELKEFRAGEDAVLNTYGWEDPGKGIAGIPVPRASALVA